MRRGATSTDMYFFIMAAAFAFIGLYAVIVLNNAYELDGAYEGIGFRQSAILSAYEDVDAFSIYTNIVARHASQVALLRFAFDGGRPFAEPACGLIGSFTAWNTIDDDCFDDPGSLQTDAELQEYFVVAFRDLWNHPGVRRPVTYSFVLTPGDDLRVQGTADDDIFVPILGVKNDGVRAAELIRKEEALQTVRDQDSADGLTWPAPQRVVNSCYGERSVGDGFHDGIDINTVEGDRIYAVADGVVESVCEEWVGACACSIAPGAKNKCADIDACSGKCGNFGNTVLIRHADDLFTRYSHLQDISVEKGESVHAGEAIGSAGSTGYSTGPHLDLKVYQSREDVNKPASEEPGTNPLCFFSQDVLVDVEASPVAQSCRDKYGTPAVLDFTNDVLVEECSGVSFEVSLNRCIADRDVQPVDVYSGNNDRVEATRENIERYGLAPIITKAANDHEISEAFLKAVITRETNGVPWARSPTGALGIMQFVTLTAHDYDLRAVQCCPGTVNAAYTCHTYPTPACNANNDDRLDPAKAIPAGARYLKDLLNLYQGRDAESQAYLAAQSYNSGLGNVGKALDACGGQVNACFKQWLANKGGLDAEYGEQVLAYMAAWGGSVEGVTTDLQCQDVTIKNLGGVWFKPHFDVRVKDGVSPYAALVSWAQEQATINNNLHDIPIDAPRGWTIAEGYCEADFLSSIVEGLQECMINQQEDCVCPLNADFLADGEYELRIRDGIADLYQEFGDEWRRVLDSVAASGIENVTIGIEVDGEAEITYVENAEGSAMPDQWFAAGAKLSDEELPACFVTNRLRAYCADSDVVLADVQNNEPMRARFGLAFTDEVLPDQSTGAQLVAPTQFTIPFEFTFAAPRDDDVSGVFVYCEGTNIPKGEPIRVYPDEFERGVHSMTISECGGLPLNQMLGQRYTVSVHTVDFGGNENTAERSCRNSASITYQEVPIFGVPTPMWVPECL